MSLMSCCPGSSSSPCPRQDGAPVPDSLVEFFFDTRNFGRRDRAIKQQFSRAPAWDQGRTGSQVRGDVAGSSSTPTSAPATTTPADEESAHAHKAIRQEECEPRQRRHNPKFIPRPEWK